MDEYHEDLEMSSPFYYLISKSLFFLFLVVPAATVVVIVAMIKARYLLTDIWIF